MPDQSPSGLPIATVYRPDDVAVDYAHDLGDPGSYPFTREGRFGTSLVARGNDEKRLDEAAEALKLMIRDAGGEPVDGEPV